MSTFKAVSAGRCRNTELQEMTGKGRHQWLSGPLLRAADQQDGVTLYDPGDICKLVAV